MKLIIYTKLTRRVGKFNQSRPKGSGNISPVDSIAAAGSDSNDNVGLEASGLTVLDQDQGSTTTATTTGTTRIQLASPRASAHTTHTNLERSTYYWDISEQVLSTLTSAAQSAPVPYLASLSAVALSIVHAVQGARGNQAELGELAKMACDLVSMVLKTYEDLNPPAPESDPNSDADETQRQTSFSSNPTLNSHVGQLVNTLQNIDSYIQGIRSRKLVQRIISYKSDRNVIENLRRQLIEAKDNFKIQSLIALRSSVGRMEMNMNIKQDECNSNRDHSNLDGGLQDRGEALNTYITTHSYLHNYTFNIVFFFF
ncbi:hypothetical protein FB446DRAFT_771981, partial [Lentinula raphanica]